MIKIRERIIYAMMRSARNAIYPIAGLIYDYTRLIRYSNWKSTHSGAPGNYKAVKIYHRLEKSLSFREPKKDSGWSAARDLYNHYILRKNHQQLGFHEQVGLKVLSDFVKEREANSSNEDVRYFSKNNPPPLSAGGVDSIKLEDLLSGKLENPEIFFKSRRSVRDFSSKSVEKYIIARAISLAANTPSVCNRQAWHVYHIDSRAAIDHALSFQNGNKGFGHEVPCLLIVTADLRAFDAPGERYQHWIDGGMFSMSLVMALHSIGISSCCLNWSKGPKDDFNFRKEVKIAPHHSIVMMIAVGHPNENIKVCASARTPLDETYSYLD